MLDALMERLRSRKQEAATRVFTERDALVRHVVALPATTDPVELDKQATEIDQALESLNWTHDELYEKVRHTNQRQNDMAIVADADRAAAEFNEIASQLRQLEREYNDYVTQHNAKVQVLVAKSEPLKTRKSYGDEAKSRLRNGCKNQEILARIEELVTQCRAIGVREIEITDQLPRTIVALSHNRSMQTSLDKINESSRQDLIAQQQLQLDAMHQEKADGRARQEQLQRQIAELEQLKISSEF